jgi:transposase-like protein
MTPGDNISEDTVELIARRVAEALRQELAAIAADLAKPDGSEPPLTVDDVAERFGVARSTVYAHWREWGGYKLGSGQKTAIRFPPDALAKPSDSSTPRSGNSEGPEAAKRRSRPRGRSVLRGAPRLPVQFGDES